MEIFRRSGISDFRSSLINRAEQELDLTLDERQLLHYLTIVQPDEEAASGFPERPDEFRVELQKRVQRAKRLIDLLGNEPRMRRILQVARQWMSELHR